MMGKRRILMSITMLIVMVMTFAVAPVSTSFADESTFLINSQIAQDDTRFTEIYEEVSPSIVAISVTFQGGFGGASGSGFIIDVDGHIVTNSHVIDSADRIEVMLFDGTRVRASVVAVDVDSDLAVIQVDLPADKLRPIEFADSNELRIGQLVVAIGSPFGQLWTMTTGIISALDRTIPGLGGFSIGGVIQTDAAINPGNSGGPLLNMDGQVIGVNSQINTETGTNSGIGFAVPSNLVSKVATDLIDQGFVDYSFIGIRGGDVSLDLIEAYDLPNDLNGVVVDEVLVESPAAEAGLRSSNPTRVSVPVTFDVLTAVNGESIRSMDSLISYLARETEPGQTVTFTILRNGTEELDVDVTLSSRPE